MNKNLLGAVQRLLDSLLLQTLVAVVSIVILLAGLSSGLSLLNEPSWLMFSRGVVVIVFSIAQAIFLCGPLYSRIVEGMMK